MTRTLTPITMIRTSAPNRLIHLHVGTMTRLPRHEQHAHRDPPP